MADIGSTLRETRIRRKIDITTVEAETKIRAKYLRALENEEWGVMPGPTYVKSFLRTYAEYLGLDAHMLVEEYRARYEQPEDLEVPAFAPTRPPLGGRVRPPGPPSRSALIAALAIGFIALLFVLGITGDDEDEGADRSATTTTETERAGERRRSQGTTTPAADAPRTRSRRVSVSVVATRSVWVCLVDANERRLVEGRTMTEGETEGPFRSRRFEVTVGNGGADLRIAGRRRDLPETAEPQGYAITRSAVRRLPADERPTCEAEGS